MRVKVEEIGSGLHPNQVLVRIRTVKGPETVAIDRHSLARNNTIEVGHPVSKHGQYRLIELPAETSSGAWRVWIDHNIACDGELEAAE
jgi:hypothetical protein